jgi:phosphoribosylformylglycinamidine synthase II
MLSESQERMLLVVQPEHVEQVRTIFDKWDLKCKTIGVVTGDERLKVSYLGTQIADIPAESLVLGGGAPVYTRESRQPAYIEEMRKFDQSTLPEPANYAECLLELLASPNICSRRWISTQYDTMVRTNTVSTIIGDAAVIRIKGSKKALAAKTDCNPRYVYLNPFVGAQIAVAESARNVVCVGARPLAITNCLNFGNPYKPEIFWQFKESIRGISEACTALGTPVTGGNVSFYNENPDGAIYPTPVIGMVGEIADVSKAVSAAFKQRGDAIFLLGMSNGHLGGTEYLKLIHGKVAGDTPPLDLKAELNLQRACLEMIDRRLLQSAHDISDGGLAVALAECCIFAHDEGRSLGARIDVPPGRGDAAYLFGEDQSRIIISARKADTKKLQAIAEAHGVPVAPMGEVVDGEMDLRGMIRVRVEQLAATYNGSLERRIR